jgi:hypothetical protein
MTDHNKSKKKRPDGNGSEQKTAVAEATTAAMVKIDLWEGFYTAFPSFIFERRETKWEENKMNSCSRVFFKREEKRRGEEIWQNFSPKLSS